MNKYLFSFIIIIISLAWIFLRYYDLWLNSMWIDEWYSSIVSYYAYQNDFVPFLPSGRYDFSQYIFTLFQSISFDIFWYSDFSSRIVSFFFWIFTLILVIIFSNNFLQEHKYKNYGVIFITALFTFSTWQIIWSREARFYELLGFIYLTSIYTLWKYCQKYEYKYLLLFCFITLLWIIFHPFCFALLGIGFFIILYKIYEEYLVSKNLKNTFLQNYKWIIIFFIIIIIHLIVANIFKYISVWVMNIWNPFPTFFETSQDIKKWYTLFYIQNLWSELWVLFIAYIFWIIYFLFTKKIRECIIFWLIFVINFYIITQKWFMAHSRYMFHLYSIITIIGWYFIFLFSSYYIDIIIQSKNKIKKILSFILMILLWLSITFTFQYTFFPKKIYYIDATSPKPDFKSTYELLKDKKDMKIISWFPHMCFLYNVKNTWICEYALKVNLTGSTETLENIQSATNNDYTNTPYLNNLHNIDVTKYYFVLDDLTIKNAVHKDIIQNIKSNCNLIYSNKWNYEIENFIWIWKCETNFSTTF